MVQRRKYEENGTHFKNIYLATTGLIPSNLLCRVMYKECIKYVNLIQIGPVVIEIQRVENCKLAVPVNNTLVHHKALLAADTQQCVLIY